MFTILIQEKGGEQRRMVFNKPEVTIGRVQGNDIVLPKGNVSKRHARIVLKDGKFIIVDLKSTNGTYVNGRKITSPLVVKDSDKIYIGDFIVGVDEAASGDADQQSETTTSPPQQDRAASSMEGQQSRPPRPTEAAPMPMPMPMGGGLGGPNASGMGMAGMGGMGGGMGGPAAEPPPPMAPPAPRPGPPRPAPGAPRDLGPPSGPPPGAAPREPLAPLGPREPLAPRDMPPIASPPPGGRPNLRPGGTMPPPMAPMGQPMSPPPQAPQAAPTVAMSPAPDSAPAPVATLPPPAPIAPAFTPAPPAPRPAPQPMAPPPAAAAAPPMIAAEPAPAPVVPLQNKGRQLVGQGAKKVVGRPLSVSKRGVQLEPLDPKIVKMLDLQSNILERLRAKLDLDKVPMDRLHEEELWQKAERATIDLVETLETSGELPKYIDQDSLIKETLNEALALGPLEDLLADESLDEVLIDRRDRVVVGKNGVLRGSGKAFSSDDVFERVVKRLVHEAGSVIDENRPVVDLRMRDGTRLTAAVSPVAARGACLVLKKPAVSMPTLQDLVGQNALSSGMADFLATCIAARRNILVCGGPASGKTSLIAALAQAAPAGERIVSVEDVAELAVGRDEWIQLEARPGTGRTNDVDLAHLVEMALRFMPDRLVVGEVRGREALPLVHALNASVDGAVVGMSGEGANATLNKLATLVRAAQHGGDAATRELVASSFEIVVHVVRHADGNIKVHSIEEVTGVSETTFDTNVVFNYANNGFSPTGQIPSFYSELEAQGIKADRAVFR
ncbi:MAG: ATPase, T2SS/T4P/T4SS family [Kofleriaceae bacterium]